MGRWVSNRISDMSWAGGWGVGTERECWRRKEGHLADLPVALLGTGNSCVVHVGTWVPTEISEKDGCSQYGK